MTEPGIERIEIAGGQIEAGWVGAGTAARPVIVMLHEALGSIAHWRRFPSELGERTGTAVLVYSRPGHGGSSVPDRPRPLDYLRHESRVILPAVLAHYQVERPILFGHSDGATIALMHAAFFPASPAGIVLLAPHVCVEAESLAGIEAARSAYHTTPLRSRLSRYHDDVDHVFEAWTGTWLDPAFASWTIRPLLPAIRCPILAIQGADDAYGTQAQLDEIVAALPRTECLMLPACGHAPHREQPVAVLDRTARFIAAIRDHQRY